jgi:hypothetical protein
LISFAALNTEDGRKEYVGKTIEKNGQVIGIKIKSIVTFITQSIYNFLKVRGVLILGF